MFERLKRQLLERVQKNCVEIPDVTYVDKNGVTHTETILLKRSDLPLVGDWVRVYPPVEEKEDGTLKFNLINLFFGGKKNLIRLIILMGIGAMVLFAFKELFNQYEALASACKPFLNVSISP